MASKVDRELAEFETRTAEREEQAKLGAAKKSGVGKTLKRVAKDALVRRTSTKR